MMGTWAGLRDYAVCMRVFTEGEEGVPLFPPLAVTSAHQGSDTPSIPPSLPPSIPPPLPASLLQAGFASSKTLFTHVANVLFSSLLDLTLCLCPFFFFFFHICFYILVRAISHLKNQMFGHSWFLNGFICRISHWIWSY